MFKTSRGETPFDPQIPQRPGWEGMHVHWLADRNHGSTETAVFNATEFPPNRWHELHRHPSAEEYFFVLTAGMRCDRGSARSGTTLTPSLAKEGVSVTRARATPTPCLQELSAPEVTLQCADDV